MAQTCGECLETPVFIVAAVALFGGLALLNYWQPSAVVGWIALVVGLLASSLKGAISSFIRRQPNS